MVSFIQAVTAVSILVKACLAANTAIQIFNGPYGVGTATAELINTKLLDPYAPTKQDRRLMVSAFYPVAEIADCQHTNISYMPAGTAAVYDQEYGAAGLPNGTFEALHLALCGNTLSQNPPKNKYPLAIFSPGLGFSRLIYSSFAASLAALGYVVVTVDHPYDADVVEFPNGDLVMAANINDSDVSQLDTAVAVRTKDLSFVMDQMRNRTVTRSLLQKVYGKMNPSQTFVFGHSIGGAAAAETMLQDHRPLAGVNLDGTLFGQVVSEGLDKPFMFFEHDGKNQSTEATWASIWTHLNSSKAQMTVVGSQHGTFTDFPIIVDTLGLRALIPSQELTPLIGSVKGERILTIVTTYVNAFFQFVLGHPPAPLLQQASPKFPDVVVANSTLTKR
ncbi:hypothetical protein PV08_07109 [Exophiala spinifera]|uniref:1-alkyl-2-acetylglycerophosphocholine esterase n=1 Tax=Exophiala spinifera TaxID=91928 RepID=A0A0D1ZNA6_9EURO|nr:uncharacterized protein PV08_07109 [Exophiala spinifera]KIW14327.1 hypothetical protein PV08_07109 [Exophiala spinifera]